MVTSSQKIDRQVGRRVRLRREALNISRSRLGRLLGVTSSQVQKYEDGENQTSAGRLYQIAMVLNVSVDQLFENEAATSPNMNEPQEDVQELINLLGSIRNRAVRQSVLALVCSISEQAKRDAELSMA